MLCKSSLLSTVISFVYKDKWWFDESMPVIFCIENTWKRILLFPLHIELNLKIEEAVRKSMAEWKALFKRE